MRPAASAERPVSAEAEVIAEGQLDVVPVELELIAGAIVLGVEPVGFAVARTAQAVGTKVY